MIHEIAPFEFKNEYKKVRPTADSGIFVYKDKKILLKEAQGVVSYPAFFELPEVVRKRGRFTYLFSIDEKAFFLLSEFQELCETMPEYRYENNYFLRKGGPKEMIYAGLVAIQLGGWYREHRYCGGCGAKMAHDGRERMMRCPVCGQKEYPKLCPCVIVGITNGDKILVTKYRGPATSYYALVAGFAEVGEDIEGCVHREVMEETGLRVKNLKYYKSQPWPLSESLLFGFFCEVDGSDEITLDENELSMAAWLSREELNVTFGDFALTNEMLYVFQEGKV